MLAERRLGPAAVGRQLGPGHALEALDLAQGLFELVHLRPRELGGGGNDGGLDDLLGQLGAVAAVLELGGELGESADAAALVLDHEGRQIPQLQAEAKVGLVIAEAPHRLVEVHAGKAPGGIERPEVGHPGSLEQVEHQALDHPEEIVLVAEGQLDVDLGELGLTVQPHVLVAEAFDDLEVAVVARDHEQLLVQLGALGQRVEAACVQTRGDHEVAGAAHGVLDQHGRLELDEALVGEIVAGGAVDVVTKPQRPL